MKKYKVGLDLSSIGYFVLMEKNKIVDICQVPKKENIYKKEINDIKEKIKELESFLTIKGQMTKTKDKIKELKREIIRYEDTSPRSVKNTYDWLKKYKENIEVVIIEKPLLQSNNPTSIQSLCKMAEYLGICTTMLDLLEIPYNIISIQDWRSNFDFVKPPKSCDNKREFTKQEAIRIAEENIINIKDYYIPKGCKKINSDICESSLLGVL